MAHIVSNPPRSSFGFGAVREFFARLSTAWENQARIRQTINELSRLSDAELADLGIARSDIARIAISSVEDATRT